MLTTPVLCTCATSRESRERDRLGELCLRLSFPSLLLSHFDGRVTGKWWGPFHSSSPSFCVCPSCHPQPLPYKLQLGPRSIKTFSPTSPHCIIVSSRRAISSCLRVSSIFERMYRLRPARRRRRRVWARRTQFQASPVFSLSPPSAYSVQTLPPLHNHHLLHNLLTLSIGCWVCCALSELQLLGRMARWGDSSGAYVWMDRSLNVLT